MTSYILGIHPDSMHMQPTLTFLSESQAAEIMEYSHENTSLHFTIVEVHSIG